MSGRRRFSPITVIPLWTSGRFLWKLHCCLINSPCSGCAECLVASFSFLDQVKGPVLHNVPSVLPPLTWDSSLLRWLFLMALLSLQPAGPLRFRVLLGLGVSGVFWRWLFSSALGAEVTWGECAPQSSIWGHNVWVLPRS